MNQNSVTNDGGGSFVNTYSGGAGLNSFDISGVVGSLKSSNPFSGGFAGIDLTNVYQIETAILNYCTEIENEINTFNPEGDIEIALKGQAKDAAYEFVTSIKELLKAYVSTMKLSCNDLNKAAESYKTRADILKSSVEEKASEIRSAASNIKLD